MADNKRDLGLALVGAGAGLLASSVPLAALVLVGGGLLLWTRVPRKTYERKERVVTIKWFIHKADKLYAGFIRANDDAELSEVIEGHDRWTRDVDAFIGHNLVNEAQADSFRQSTRMRTTESIIHHPHKSLYRWSDKVSYLLQINEQRDKLLALIKIVERDMWAP
jgi:hypothetical protein